jgi:hypothetical protein
MPREQYDLMTLITLAQTYHGVTEIWPEITPTEFKAICSEVIGGDDSPVISVEDFINRILEILTERHGVPFLSLLTMLNRPRPFNMGAVNN